jgi:hypothetical protein
MKIRIRALLAPLAISAGLLATSPVAQAAEEETHVFSATLSLTGDCSTSTLDPVPDPGLCPGTVGVDHPSEPFRLPKAVAVDKYGDRYVASYGPEQAEPNQGRIDVFGPEGKFITELADPNYPKTVTVDSQGNLYVSEESRFPKPGGLPGEVQSISRIVRYAPSAPYEPRAGEIEYANPPTILVESEEPSLLLSFAGRLAIDPTDDHVFFNQIIDHRMGYPGTNGIWEFGSAAEGNPVLDETIGEGQLASENSASGTVAIDAAHGRIYADRHINEGGGKVVNVIQVFELTAPHALLGTLEGSSTPAGAFNAESPTSMSLAVEESTGHLFVGEFGSVRRIYELAIEEEAEELRESYVSTISEPKYPGIQWSQMALDNGAESPNRGTLYVPSGEGNPGHDLAFIPKPPLVVPAIEATSAGGVTETEAVLHATVNPNGQPTTYRFEYTTQQSFEAEGFASATLAKEGSLPGAGEGIAVSAAATGLAPDTEYRFRVVAEDEAGEVEVQAAFKTYRPLDQSQGCSNEALRLGASAALPDCRAYELVTPTNTNGRPPISVLGEWGSDPFPSRTSSAGGERVSFLLEGGALPGFEGTGSLAGDTYLARRTPQGWLTSATGPNGHEALQAEPGGVSPDQEASFWIAQEGGSAVIGGDTPYIRYPDGHSELIGTGSVGTDPRAQGKLISQGAGHVVFVTPPNSQDVQLEPDAPPTGTAAVYDRTADGVTQVVSLLPGNETPAAGEDATYVGASLDGKGIAFKIGEVLYLRVDDEATYEIGEKLTFEGVAEGGSRLFYLQGGDLYAFDAPSEARTPFVESADATAVNVSPDGDTVYFLSSSVLVGEDRPGPHGALPVEGAENLYRSHEGQISFIGRVTKFDVEGEAPSTGQTPALGAWANALAEGGKFYQESSRTTPDGGVLVFESRADLTGYDSEGHAEIYRYDSAANSLTCLSCSPTGQKASGEASLQTNSRIGGAPPLDAWALVGNLRDDGRRVVFQSQEALVPADADGVQDVYEWEAEEVGSCRTSGGCDYLISSGRSAQDNWLYGVSASGDDVFFTTHDLLDPARDPDETPSIYDARVNGGFPPPAANAGECLGEACQPAASPPSEATPTSASFHGAGNVKQAKAKARCPKRKRLLKHRGKRRCVATYKRHHRHRRHHHRRHPAKSRRGANR